MDKKREKRSTKEQEKHLLARIEKTKKDLLKLQQRRQLEIGRLACKHRLDELPNKELNVAFAKLAKELQHDKS